MKYAASTRNTLVDTMLAIAVCRLIDNIVVKGYIADLMMLNMTPWCVVFRFDSNSIVL